MQHHLSTEKLDKGLTENKRQQGGTLKKHGREYPHMPKRLFVSFPPELGSWIEKEARKNYQTQASIVRQAVAQTYRSLRTEKPK